MGNTEPMGALPAARSVLVVCAHPDDESFGLGAVLDRYVAAGTEVTVLCFTHGEASSLGETDRPLSEIRRAELAEAASALGLSSVELLDRPDGSLAQQPLEELGAAVRVMANRAGADLVLVFDEGGVTGHPDHHRATEAALAGAPDLPVLAWTVPCSVADALNTEFGANFAGRADEDIDLVVRVERTRQGEAIACHTSQSGDNPILWRRLELLGGEESLRWLRRPAPAPPSARKGPSVADPAASDDFRALGEEWDRRYASAPQVLRTEPDESLVDLVSPLRPGIAVDLGAGEGRNSLWLARRGWSITSVDASQVALHRLSQAAMAEGLPIRTVVDDLVSYLTDARTTGEAFDLVVLAYVHPEPSARAELLAAGADALRPGGHLFVVGHHVSSYGLAGPPDPERLYREDDLRAVPGVEVISLGLRPGESDLPVAGTDVLLWACRRGTTTPAS